MIALLDRRLAGVTTPILLVPVLLFAGLALFKPTLRADETQTATQHKYTNALIHSTSPYLLQHAHNPVNWMPWGPEAFAKAKAENKPIFVSIGYSTCYWCHVMERESFENEQVAEILNAHYVAIKVDREERPDIDEQLMLATQLLTGRGGWPNSVWLTVDGRPWMTGTYFPRQRFIETLNFFATAWKEQPDNIEKQADSLSAAIRRATEAAQAVSPDFPSENAAGPSLLPPAMQRALAELSQIFDERHGGFGTEPKFPPHGALRLLAHQAARGDERARQMLTKTLDAIWCGGIHDHIGGGFHRYSTDERWFLPHFEKMLYDNAQLMRAYTEAFTVTRNDRYREAVLDIYTWLMREMRHEQGGFYSAIDSESEGGEEGRYYTWSLAELNDVLAAQAAESFARAYNCSPEGNFVEEATGHRPGTNIPFLRLEQWDRWKEQDFRESRNALLLAKQRRDYPHLDDKVLTAWNGLMISSLARAGAVFGDSRFLRAGEQAADFILEELLKDGTLSRSWRNGQTSQPGYLDDYAFFIEGLLELYIATDEEKWLRHAERLAERMLQRFEDPQGGGFYFTSPDHEELLLRSKNLMGGGNLPVGNGIAVQILGQLEQETGKAAYGMSARRALQAFTGLMQRAPRQVEHLVLADAIFRDLASPTSESHSANGEPNGSLPDASYRDAAAQLKLYLSQKQVAPGETILAAIEFDIDESFHLYSPANKEVPVRTTNVRISETAGLTLGKFEYPEGESHADRFLGQNVFTYSGNLRLIVPLKVSTEIALGGKQIEFAIDYQACDDQRCLLPQDIRMDVRIEVVRDPERRTRHPEIFKP